MIIEEYSGVFFCLADENRDIIYNKLHTKAIHY